MGKWADLARAVEEIHPRANSANSASSPPIGTNDTIGTVSPNPCGQRRIDDQLGEWRTGLAKLDLSMPPLGFAAVRWSILLGDARWLAQAHGDAAAALGWTASDLFGIDPRHPGWGGLVDRLDGARQVALTDSVAHWRGEGVEGWLWRRTLTPKPPLWHACSFSQKELHDGVA